MRESGCRQSLAVCGNSFWQQNVLQCGALAADFELAVRIAPLMLVVKIDE